MDHIRKELDQLMGKDRNLPLSRRGKRKEHFDDPDVPSPSNPCLRCASTSWSLSVRTTSSRTRRRTWGSVRRGMTSISRSCTRGTPTRRSTSGATRKISWVSHSLTIHVEYLEKIVSQLDSKIRRTLAKIDVPMDADRPKEIQEKYTHPLATMCRIEGLHKKINFFLDQAERLGEEGKLEESESIMKEIERLKMQKAELASMSENPLLQNEKQMHVSSS